MLNQYRSDRRTSALTFLGVGGRHEAGVADHAVDVPGSVFQHVVATGRARQDKAERSAGCYLKQVPTTGHAHRQSMIQVRPGANPVRISSPAEPSAHFGH